MKRIIWILPLLYCFNLGAQTTPVIRSFEISSSGSVQNIADYTRSLEHAFLDRYRALDHRTVMRFHEGVVVKLFSAKDLQALGMPVNMSVINTIPINNLEFTLLPSGRILKYEPRTTNPVTITPPKATAPVVQPQLLTPKKTN